MGGAVETDTPSAPGTRDDPDGDGPETTKSQVHPVVPRYVGCPLFLRVHRVERIEGPRSSDGPYPKLDGPRLLPSHPLLDVGQTEESSGTFPRRLPGRWTDESRITSDRRREVRSVWGRLSPGREGEGEGVKGREWRVT